ncbi:uncharacterized protein LOC143853231 isoform X2 [Tasmannia lanceolata]|uniref:uncharacterized protein LOC143853231 isoform X2 n=1 Tax=Tasmannia lanceolata TaxID=3420 RepID=UPI004064391F
MMRMKKDSTKDWVIGTFYSQNNNNLKVPNFLSGAEHLHMASLSSNDTVAKRIPSVANYPNSSTNLPILKTHQKKWRNGCQKRMNCTSNIPGEISSLANNDKLSSSNGPILKTHQRNWENRRQRRMEDQTNCTSDIGGDISSLANETKSSMNQSIPKTQQRNWGNGWQRRMEDQTNSSFCISRDISSLANDPKPSVNRLRFSYAEALLQRNQSHGYRKTRQDQMNGPHSSPKVSLYRGKPAIYFEESVIESNAEKLKYCLVGKFPRSKLSLAQIREWASRRWNLRGNCSITLLDLHHVFIRLDNELDMIRIWVRNKWWIKGRLMKVFKWTPQFRPAREEPSSAAVWIALPFLPVVFFQEDVLFSIASLVGRALAIDDPTRILSRTNVARVCVEVSLLMKLPHRVWIGIGGRGFWQDIHYENLPSYCANCCQQGHSTRICKFKMSDIVTSDSEQKTTDCSTENSNSAGHFKKRTESSPENLNSAIQGDRHVQEQRAVSEASLQNSVNGETSSGYHAQIRPAIQYEDAINKLATEASSQSPSPRVTLLEALTEHFESSQKMRSSKNEGNLGFGGAFTSLSIMNETFKEMEDERDTMTLRKQTLNGKHKKDLLEKEEHVLEIETENQQQQQKHVKDSTRVMMMNDENKKSQEKRAPPTRSFLANKPIFFWRKKTKSSPTVDAFLRNNGYPGLNRYKYLDVETMTRSFRYKIGEGGFGPVFKGMLPDRRLVAIKVLRDSKNGEKEFITEIASIGRTNHLNVISLLGFCSDGSKRALIYEYVHNGSLDKFIYTSELRPILVWEKLCQIAVGIARGLEYLHHGNSISILHFDIKPSNILLDEDFCPKISDFGLSKLCPTRDFSSLKMSCPRGTIGYIAPELVLLGSASDKSDVFSYGIMLLEMVSGRKTMDLRAESYSETHIHDWIYQRLSDPQDIGLGGSACLDEEETEKKMTLVGLWCTQLNPDCRPSMSMVLEMLEGSIESLKLPPRLSI